MRFKTIVTLFFVPSLSVFASNAAAQGAAQNPPPPAQAQQEPGGPGGPGQRPDGPVIIARRGTMPPGMMSQGMMGMMGPMTGTMMGPMTGRDQRSGGPLQRVSRLLAALDDPRVRTMLGLTDQQATSLRKIVVDTETFTIKTGADIAVDTIELRELLRADKPDRAAVMAKGDEISKDTSQLINHGLDAMLAAKAILTPEQQKMIREYMERGGATLRLSTAPAAPPTPPARP